MAQTKKETKNDLLTCHLFLFFRSGHEEHHADGVVPPPMDPNSPGENGKAVKIENPDKDIKKLIDEGWQKNAFNQYVSDLISVHRSLPDPRDEWYDVGKWIHLECLLFKNFER